MIKTVVQPNHSMYFKTTDSSFGPAHAINSATRKKCADRPTRAANMKGNNAIDNAPAVSVNNLKGIGEKPATTTAQNPHSANQRWAVIYLSQ